MAKTRHEKDFYKWANQQAALLRAGKFSDADIDNIAEEIASLARNEASQLIDRLGVVLFHLLKWQFQPGLQSYDWKLAITSQRQRLANQLEDNPSLRITLKDAIAEAYEDTLIAVQRDTGLPKNIFSSTCPYTIEQIFDSAFYPEDCPLAHISIFN